MPYSSQYIEKFKKMFVHLHVHSEFSNLRLLDSINKIPNMIKYVVSLGQNALALTDHECLSGHVKFLRTIEEMKENKEIPQDFKPILGNEIYLTDKQQMWKEIKEEGRTTFYHFLLLAKDKKGNKQLKRLSTITWENNYFNYKGMDRVPTFYSDVEKVTGEEKGHLIASTACLGGYLAQNILKILNANNEDEIMEYKYKIHDFITWCIDIFGKDDFYIELQPSQMEEQIEYNKMAINIAKAYGLKYIVTTDAHYLKKEDREIHKAYLTSNEEGNSNREVDNFYSSTHFFTVEALFESLNYLSKEEIENCIKNTKEITDKVEIYSLEHKQVIPKIPIKFTKELGEIKNIYDCLKKYEYINSMIESDEEYDNYLIFQIAKGINKKIEKDDYKETFERINIECKEILGISKIKHEPMSSYFITMQKNIDIIWEEANSIVMPSRGSAGGYIIDYLLGITQIDPLKQGVYMPHWRFISAERPDYPDIDIDFPSYKRDIVFQCLLNYYKSIGGDIVRVCTFGTETAKSAIQTACRGLHINSDIGLYLSSLIPVERGTVWSLSDCYYGNDKKNRLVVTEFKNLVDEYKDKKLLEVALGIEGLINKRSSHACFDKDTLITTSKGLKKIINIKKGDLVLTHKNRFKPVIDTMITKTNEEYTVYPSSSFPLKVTGNHPFLVRERLDSKKKIFSNPKWKEVSELRVNDDYVGIPINKLSIIPSKTDFDLPFDNKYFWWVVGRYIGDGWTECYERGTKNNKSYKERRTIICCSKINNNEKLEIVERLNKINFDYRIEESRTTYKIFIKNKEFYEYLQNFGKYAHGKYINEDVLNLPQILGNEFLNGYLSADGSFGGKTGVYSFKTTSKKLANGISQLINKIYKRHISLSILPPRIDYIEGRKVYAKEKYSINFTKDKRRKEKSFYEDGYIWTRVRKIEKQKVKLKDMYNLTVSDDSSYVANGVAVHNCGILIINEDFTNFNAKMRTPSGELVSQFDLHDSEYVGNIKYDFLNTKTCAMIQKCLEMLIEHGKVEWQGNLRKTYDKYLHPDVIDKDTKAMWELLNDGQLISAFQFDSPVGQQALKAIKPTNLLEASAGNTLMRLMVEDGKEQPLEMYIRYKQNINEWYEDMKKFGLNDKEIKLMKKHLEKDYGVCSTQESMMLLSMDENIANFNVIDSNKLRKAVAKKKPKLLKENKNKLYEQGLKLGASKTLLDYVWEEQISMQKGYGFSILHTIGYTYILIQQLNLIYYYPSIYWNTAVLLIESGAVEIEQMEEDDEEIKEKSTNYGTVAKAIGNMQENGVKISLPYINEANIGFEPYEEENEILFGLKGIMKINNETANLIIQNRPFQSLKDFYKKMVLTKRKVKTSKGKIQNKSLVSDSATIMLIKAGAFDKIENKPREQILEDYLRYTRPPKKKLSNKAINTIIEMGIVPSELKKEVRFFKFREYIKSLKKVQDKDTKSIKWYCLKGYNDEITEYTNNFFIDNFGSEMEEDKDYKYDNEGNLWVAMGTTRIGSFENIYEEKINNFSKWLQSNECINTYNENIFNEVKSNNMAGSVSTWEMESMNFYYHEHELKNVDNKKYDIVNYFELPEEPKVIGFNIYKGLKYPKFELVRIAGTVLDRDKNRHSVSLLTPNGVVNIKFYSGQFAFYDRQISVDNEDGKGKTILEDGWFKRGTKLLVTGFRRGDQFKPKVYKNSIYQHSVYKIVEIKENGSLIMQTERVRIDNE